MVTINLYLDTQGKVINNAEANIQFPNDLLEIVSVKGSLFTLWVENPNFSNNSGSISFNGGIPDPGYSGSGAKVLTIIAKAKKTGTASLMFGGAAVRENDGLGTDILSGQSSASILIVSNAKEAETPIPALKPPTSPKTEVAIAVTEIDKLPTPIIVSPTYPNPNSWYPTKSAALNWKIPNNTSAVQTLIDNNPNSTPVVKYSPAISSKNISDLSDGIWYFHLRYLVNNFWSKTASFKIQIDSTPPLGLSALPEKNNNFIIGLRIKAEDDLSGIDYYNLIIDNQPIIKVSVAEAKNMIPWSPIKVGNHQISLTAYDKAGNHAELLTQINSDESITSPIIEEIATKSPSVITDASNSNLVVGEISTTSQKINNNLDLYLLLFNIFKLLLILILLFGWYKYIVIKKQLILNKKRAKNLTLSMLLEKANKDLLVLEKAQKKNILTKNEEKSLNSLKKTVGDIETISLQKRVK